MLKFQRLMEVKGVGERTAIAILTDMQDVSNFEKSESVTPAHFESGTSVKGKSHISKIRVRRLRKILYMSAINVKNYNPYFKNFVERLQQKGKPPKVIICAIMRKLLVIFFGMLKNSTAFDQKLAFRP